MDSGGWDGDINAWEGVHMVQIEVVVHFFCDLWFGFYQADDFVSLGAAIDLFHHDLSGRAGEIGVDGVFWKVDVLAEVNLDFNFVHADLDPKHVFLEQFEIWGNIGLLQKVFQMGGEWGLRWVQLFHDSCDVEQV